MKVPFIKFYPSDWRADPALRMCSLAARGLWLEMIRIMHEAEPYGFLIINAEAVTLRQLARNSAATLKEVSRNFAELEAAGVFSRDAHTGAVYSRRMLKDKAKAEADRAAGKLGGNPNIVKRLNPTDKPSRARVPEARYHIVRKEEPPDGGSKKKTATRLSENWEVPPEWVSEAVAEGLPHATAAASAERMKNWSLSNPNGVRLDWHATWRNWFRRDIRDPRSTGPTPPTSGKADDDGAAFREFLHRKARGG